MKFEEYKYTLPAFWASPLINDDYTGLSDEEEAELNTFLEKTASDRGNGHWVLEDSEPSFCKYHDAQPYGVLAVDCLEFKWMKRQNMLKIYKKDIADEEVYQNYTKAAFAKIGIDEDGEYVVFLICPQ